MKYKPGDKVKIRNDLQAGKHYDLIECCKPMEEYRGRVVTISDITEVNVLYSSEVYITKVYTIKEDEGHFSYGECMLKPIDKSDE